MVRLLRNAAKVIKIMMTADGWCGYCARDMADLMKLAFPDHSETISHVMDQFSDIEEAYRSAHRDWRLGGGVGPEPQPWDKFIEIDGGDEPKALPKPGY